MLIMFITTIDAYMLEKMSHLWFIHFICKELTENNA